MKKGAPNNSDFLQNWFPPEIRSPFFNLYKFQDAEKSTPESSRMHWNLMNDEEIGYLKLLKLKYRRGDQIIQTFCRTVPPKILVPPSLICRNFKLWGKYSWIISEAMLMLNWIFFQILYIKKILTFMIQ